MPYRQAMERAQLSIEQNTENVPDDNRFYVIHAGEICANFSVLKLAQKKYQEIFESLKLPPLPQPTPEERKAAMDRATARITVDKMAMDTFAAAKRRNQIKKTRTFG